MAVDESNRSKVARLAGANRWNFAYLEAKMWRKKKLNVRGKKNNCDLGMLD